MTINKFIINKLFGTYNVSLDFSNDALILVGENGIGKTTILSIFYSTITSRVDKLLDYDFESIELFIGKSKKYIFKKNEVDMVYRIKKSSSRRMHNVFENFVEYNNKIQTWENSIEFLQQKNNILGLEKSTLKRLQKVQLQFEDLEKRYAQRVFYLPTYRRIEEDLEKLGYDEDDFDYDVDDSVIQFGMDDVSQRIENVTTNIKDSAVNGLSKVTGEMLKELVNGLTVSDEQRNAIKDGKDLDVMLARVGDNLPKRQREKIKSIIQSGKIDDEKYEPLIYFLVNLMDIYKEQKVADNAIKSFTSICNEYLYNKVVEYDESQVKINIFSKLNKKRSEVYPSQLSSGEKQIISLFSKLLLENFNEDYIVIFDEPELSLSIEWQEMILPDILNTKKCGLLLAATHSPFIYNNELESKSVDIIDCVEVVN